MNPNQIREIVREACEQAGAAGLLGQYGLAPWEEIVDRAVERIVALAAKETTP